MCWYTLALLCFASPGRSAYLSPLRWLMVCTWQVTALCFLGVFENKWHDCIGHTNASWGTVFKSLQPAGLAEWGTMPQYVGTRLKCLWVKLFPRIDMFAVMPILPEHPQNSLKLRYASHRAFLHEIYFFGRWGLEAAMHACSSRLPSLCIGW